MVRIDAGCIQTSTSRMAANCKHATEKSKVAGRRRARSSNPLGTRAIYLADGLLRIHGTNDPSSIGTNASSGCFRMYREDVEELYEMVQPGTQVIVQQ